MILSDKTIIEYISKEKIKIIPNIDKKNIRPTGIRLHLDKKILIPKPNQTVDISESQEIEYEEMNLPEDGCVLKPGNFILGSTIECIKTTNDLVGKIDGRSTIARIGMMIHCTSDTIDGNHEQSRSITLEIKNIGNFNLIIKPNMPIGMISFHKLTEHIEQKSQIQYENQNGVQAPNLYKQFV